ncbi:hypothetical protein GCM10029992_26870 [Glycomyces albus]
MLDNVLGILADHPGDARAKLEIFALLNAIAATFALNELAAGARPERAAAYLGHIAATGERPRISALWDELTAPDGDLHDRRAARLTALVSSLLR